MTTKRRFSKETRVRILARDNYRCVYCGRNSGDKDIKLTIDHIIPISRGEQMDLIISGHCV